MTTRDEHREIAEEHLEQSTTTPDGDLVDRHIARAQVHATLALSAPNPSPTEAWRARVRDR